MKSLFVVVLFVTLFGLLLVQGCGGPPPNRVIVLGIDGMDPKAMDLLISEGKLPNFARLRREGAYGTLLSSKPMLSPLLWTTIATGKPPTQHGIGNFAAVNETTGARLPVTSEMRRVKAVWNIASERDKKVGVVGWWATWPAEEVQGVVVSDHTCYHFLFQQGLEGANDAAGITYPPSLFDELEPLVRRPDEISFDEASRFIQVDPEEFSQPFDFNEDVSHFKWALATAESYRKIGLDVWQTERPDLLMVFIEATDSVSHLFGHLFHAGELHGELADQQKKFGKAVEEMYGYADRLVGEYLDVMDENTTLVIMSDHGFQLGVIHDDPSKTRDMRRVSEKYHRMEGILYMYGKGVKPKGLIDGATQIDITPTLLALLDIPQAEDMKGRVLESVLTDHNPAPRVASYESGSAVDTASKGGSTVDGEIMKHLQALGYLDENTTQQSERNLAALHFQAGEYEEAAEAYRRMIKENPGDGGLRTSLAGVLGAMGRFDEAEEHLEKAIELQPLNPESYHNLAVIEERRGDRASAVELYRNALRYHPSYEPSKQALLRLTGSPRVHEPKDDAERRAWELAEEASRTARRGDYAKAMELLDTAEETSPGSVLVYQYRSNVAYLKGDTAAAIDALERALELEPDNALFQTNLSRLKQQK